MLVYTIAGMIKSVSWNNKYVFGRPQFQLGWAGVKLTEDSSQNTLPKAGKI